MSSIRPVRSLASSAEVKVKLFLAFIGLAFFHSCSYRLPAPSPGWTLRLRVIAHDPTQYAVKIGGKPGPKPATDGTLQLTVPAFRPTCGVYLLDRIKVGGLRYPEIEVLDRAGKIVRKIPLNKIDTLRRGDDGFLILKLQ